ncbi:nitroreductase family protein [Romboutsia sp. 1001713B170207_170306_H8]|uniref:nitroreductase family protein n=1 Tax=Romboutsia sp. 1001713B170207_170306_H8 TaxID=2787112 RepID=UPI00082027E0|nr:nitroreductase family protein [Romboutsia sp. 1001713B170207_170306_H8]SCH08008.1 Putative NAD(P)H nitroreductase Spy0809 [uncultured Clostridium sp.]
MLEVIRNRRSIRKYNNKKVEEEKVKEILKAAMQAPSSKNSSPWEFIIVDDKNLIENLSKTHHRAKHINGSQVCIVVLGNKERFIKAGKWIQDLGACTQNLLLEAVNQGLASCWVGVFPKNKRVEYVRSILNLPNKFVPYALIPLGYSDEKVEFIDKFDESKIHRNLYKGV